MFLLVQVICLTPTDANPPIQLSFPPLQFVPPKAERVVLDNGMVVFLLEDDELPLIEISAVIQTGSAFDPPGKIGLASVGAQVMRRGGTESRTPESINQTLEQLAASVETTMRPESGVAEMSSLKKNVSEVLPIFADVLMRPAFRDEYLRLVKQEMTEAIRRRDDNPDATARREWYKLVYGADHPYGWHIESNTIEAITRADLVAWHRNFYGPRNVRLAVAGDFKSDEMLEKLRNVFDGWESSERKSFVIPSVTRVQGPSLHHIHRSINQTRIRLGHLGVQRHNSDRWALIVMDQILGRGFTSRLVRSVRSRKGLAYSVYSFFTEPAEIGVFGMGCQTRADGTVEALTTILDEVRALRETHVTDDELAVAKDGIVNRFVFRFTGPLQIAQQQMMLEYEGYPTDYLETYVGNISSVTKDDVLRVASKYLRPDAMTILVVGDDTQFDRSLRSLGEVHSLELRP